MCGNTAKPGGRALHLDHDHFTGMIRGLLCSRCNTTEGKSDAPEFVAYREDFPTKRLGIVAVRARRLAPVHRRRGGRQSPDGREHRSPSIVHHTVNGGAAVALLPAHALAALRVPGLMVTGLVDDLAPLDGAQALAAAEGHHPSFARSSTWMPACHVMPRSGVTIHRACWARSGGALRMLAAYSSNPLRDPLTMSPGVVQSWCQ